MLRRQQAADHWVDKVFSAQAIHRGGVIRRNVSWVEREIGSDRLIDEVKIRGFHMIRCGPQYVIICNQSGIEVIC